MKVCLALWTAVLLGSVSAFQPPLPLETASSLHGRAVTSAPPVSSPVFAKQRARQQDRIPNAAGSLASLSASSSIAMSSAKYDVVVYGATSFAGQLVCEYYLTTYGASPPTFKWAMAAR